MNFLEQYHAIISTSIDEEGISVPPALFEGRDGVIIMAALAVPLTQAYPLFFKMIAENEAKQAIFAFDRYTREGQGTRFDDVMAGHYYKDGVFKPFIIEYQFSSTTVDPIKWDNPVWTGLLEFEIGQFMPKRALN